MDLPECFAKDYADARRRFQAAAAATGLPVESCAHPQAGPAGETLGTDVVRIGPAKASRVLFTISGTHGVEGFCGSGIQVATLRSGRWRALPPETALVMIHAINPWGFAWLRRVNEDNVDLNRNHIDHAGPYPDNPGYRELRDAICPATWDAATRAATAARLQAYAERHGSLALQQAITGGQYFDRAGVFFGGNALSWSAHTLYAILERHVAGARHCGVVDFHTGLGPWAHGELIGEHGADHPAARRLRHWLGGNVSSLEEGTSSSAPLTGTTGRGIEAQLRGPDSVTVVTLEYGTRPLAEVIDQVRADCWLHQHGRLDSAQGRAIKAGLRDCFFPDDEQWRQRIWHRAAEVQAAMLRGLAALP